MARSGWGQGTLRERPPGSGRWQLRWTEGIDPFTGEAIRRTETVSAKNLTEARKELAARLAGRQRVSRMTMRTLITQTLPTLPIQDTTRTTYRHALDHLPDVALDWVAADIAPTDARLIMEGLTERHGAQTVRKAHTALMACWREAAVNGWVADNPWRQQRLPKVARSAGTVLTDTELAALVDAAADGVERCWLAIHLATGARPGEVVGLRWSSIDIAAADIVVVDAKHDGALRHIAVDDGTLRIIAEWQAQQKATAETIGLELIEDPWLITSEPDASEPWRRAYAGGWRWRDLCKRAGLDRKVRLYDLRHTVNSQMAGGGVDSSTRAARVGNSPATNERVYSHSTRDREAAAMVGGWLESLFG